MATDAKTGQPIFGNYGVGLHNVGSYQASGQPWLGGGAIADTIEVKVEFPMVTKSITLIASGTMSGELRAHFVSTSSATTVISEHHYISLGAAGDSLELDVKCKEIYLSAAGDNVSYQLAAELTNIPTGRMFDLTGSGHTSA